MKVILNKTRVEQIPLVEYYQENIEHKGLVFVQHGYESTKEYGADYLAITLARRGFFVVAIDAYKHGERIQEPYITGSPADRLNEAFIVVKRTALDIIRLHHNFYIKRFKTFDIIGISLGGMVAYYAATKCKHIGKLVPVISTPDFMHQAYHAVGGAGLDVESFFTQHKLDFINSIDPLKHLNQLQYESLHIFVGTKDPVVPMEASKILYQNHGTDSDSYHEYDVDHNVPRDMQLDIFQTIDS